MGKFVTMGATLQCTMGLSPCSLMVTGMRPTCCSMNIAVTTDYTMTNIPTFGMCQSMANPAVAAATSAAMGVLTPSACTPMIAAPWTPGSMQVKVSNIAALTDNSKCMCSYGGTISITNPGNTMVECK